MASGEDSTRKCFTLMWKVENVNYGWFYCNELIVSPIFTVDEISKTNWMLQMKLYTFDKDKKSYVYLKREPDENSVEVVDVDFELAFVSPDGKVLHASEGKNAVFIKNRCSQNQPFPSWLDLFSARKSIYPVQDVLTVRCRIWKSCGEISKNAQLVARTRIVLEKTSTKWNIENFSDLDFMEEKTHIIKSLDGIEQLMTLQLWLTKGQSIDAAINLKIIPNYEIIKTSTIQLYIVDAHNNTDKCYLGEFFNYKKVDSKEFSISYSRRDLMEKQKKYLPNNTLSFLCECTYSTGKFEYEIEDKSSDSTFYGSPAHDETNEPAKDILINDLKSMLLNSELSDVKLKTRNKTHPAHKIILGARSPVFKSMFSTNMKENINDCVEIDDLSDETVLDMLQFIYSADVKELDWSRAIHLFEAADKYQILNLKGICSSYLKTNLSPNNACEALVLADLHQDEDLKRYVQDFILKDGEIIVSSDDWEKLMETHLKLAAETMRLKFKIMKD